MSSPRFVAVETQVRSLRQSLIVERNDYSDYLADDHTKAIAFRLLASAYLEQYVEERCVEIAQTGIDRIRRSQPSSTGRALLIWRAAKSRRLALPIHENDVFGLVGQADEALTAYGQMVKSSHGISGKDFDHLTFPLGLRGSQDQEILTDLLDQLSEMRDPASHTYVNRARTMSEPIADWQLVEKILQQLERVDLELAHAASHFPL